MAKMIKLLLIIAILGFMPVEAKVKKNKNKKKAKTEKSVHLNSSNYQNPTLKVVSEINPADNNNLTKQIANGYKNIYRIDISQFGKPLLDPIERQKIIDEYLKEYRLPNEVEQSGFVPLAEINKEESLMDLVSLFLDSSILKSKDIDGGVRMNLVVEPGQRLGRLVIVQEDNIIWEGSAYDALTIKIPRKEIPEVNETIIISKYIDLNNNLSIPAQIEKKIKK